MTGMPHTLALIAALGVVVSGCAVPPPPPLADAGIAPPPAWRTDVGATAPVEDWWWRQFGDPVLTDLVETALAHNIDLDIAAARVVEVRAQEKWARARLFPAIGATIDAGYGREVSPFGDGETSVFALPMFQASYELDLFGQVRDRADAARLSVAATAAARDSARIAVAATTAANYILLRALDARLEILRATSAARAEALRIARDRADAGYTSRLELEQAGAEYAATAEQMADAELAIIRQEHALSLLLGRAPGAIARGLPLRALARPAIPDTLPAALLRQRPDIAQAELHLAATDAELAAARGDFMPRIRLGAAAGGLFSDALADPAGIWLLGGSILAPIFQGGRLAANLEGAAARRNQAAHVYRRTVLTAFREVEDNLAATRRLDQRRVHLVARRVAAAEALYHAANRYRAGYSPYLDQLDAQRNLLGAELALLRVEAGQLTALVDLYRAMGGGWGDAPEG